ncbi:sigma-70 family RNA polymerase sigma factor [Myxococcus sp. AM011]|uniref:RNA polymerase sigma factor n=1 Tax=Myxococcus sp. AM011 TaxID=2745200 RepID=UPI00159507C2|nr:sigma-70 family RNA polymerase sigma factor [Myxococcus sp. AM011]NVJ24767.1 sigma-70 family RNA polymerase sigma factor [Myxococcus sp. AM011]
MAIQRKGLQPSTRTVASGVPPDLLALYQRHGATIYRRAFFLLRDADEARDVAQDVFVALVSRQERLAASPRETPSLLYEVTTCLAIDRLRRRFRRARHGPSHLLSPAPDPDMEPSHSGNLERVEAARDLAMLTRGESPRTMTVAILHFVEGRSHTEVGKELSLSPKTVRSLLKRFVNRARKRGTRLDCISPRGPK